MNHLIIRKLRDIYVPERSQTFYNIVFSTLQYIVVGVIFFLSTIHYSVLCYVYRGESMNIQFKKGALEMIVLLIIKREPQYGYALVQKISQRMIIAEGTVYPILRRLVKDQVLTTYYQPSNEGPARKYYQLTSMGEERLEQLKTEWHEFMEIVTLFIKESETT